MKKLGWLLALVLLCGCSDQTVYEPVEDVYEAVVPQPGIVQLTLPEEAAVTTLAGENGSLYECQGYTLTVQTLTGGNLNGTLETLTGCTAENLTLLETASGRYECVWTGAGEGGDQVNRLVLLDDGVYHYAVTVMAPSENAGSLQGIWDDLLTSVSLGDTGT